MVTHSYPVEVQSDFLEKITRAKPVQALAEFIWNSLDADASKVEVFFEDNDLGVLSRIIVRDNGGGIAHDRAPELFGSLGGSWKRSRPSTAGGRFLHGRDGRGRFKAFSLGNAATWDVTTRKGDSAVCFSVAMSAAKLKEVVISDEEIAQGGATVGVTLTITELHKDFQSVSSPAGLQELTEIFALYLTDYSDVSVFVGGTRIDPSGLIASRGSVNLTDIVEEGTAYAASLDIIEWRSATNRALYLCNERGFPLAEIEQHSPRRCVPVFRLSQIRLRFKASAGRSHRSGGDEPADCCRC